MSTIVNAKDPPSPQDRTRGFVEDRTRAATGLLIAVSLVCLVLGMAYLDIRLAEVQDREVQDLRQSLVGQAPTDRPPNVCAPRGLFERCPSAAAVLY